MQPDERDLALLWDMRFYAEQAHKLVSNTTFENYNESLSLRLAVERSIEILGEAARRVSPEFQQDHPEIAWRRIIGLRNILAHQYSGIDAESLWQIATEYAPGLVTVLDALLPQPPSDTAS